MSHWGQRSKQENSKLSQKLVQPRVNIIFPFLQRNIPNTCSISKNFQSACLALKLCFGGNGLFLEGLKLYFVSSQSVFAFVNPGLKQCNIFCMILALQHELFQLLLGDLEGFFLIYYFSLLFIRDICHRHLPSYYLVISVDKKMLRIKSSFDCLSSTFIPNIINLCHCFVLIFDNSQIKIISYSNKNFQQKIYQLTNTKSRSLRKNRSFNTTASICTLVRNQICLIDAMMQGFKCYKVNGIIGDKVLLKQAPDLVAIDFFVEIQSVMQLLSGTIQPKKGHQTDKYQGGLHTVSKLRHGKGTYAFDNTFFTFEGNYENGRKQGPGTLLFKDGRIINAHFQNDQMIGHAEIIYPDGSKYVGDLHHGQKQGEGTFTSSFESYEGEWKDNCRHGKGSYKNHSTNEQYEGQFSNNKPHGTGHLIKWNYEYSGGFEQGLKNGEGRQVSDWCREEGVANSLGRYEYQGEFKNDKFEGKGCFKSRQSKYVYEGEFTAGQPNLYPNEFRCFLSTNTGNAQEIVQGDRTLLLSQPIEYQLQGDSFNLYIETVYQGPQALDEIQPTQQEIDALIKNWQNENKKNKNPPPMPDFNQPRMKKPEMILVEQQRGRSIEVRLIKQVEGKEECMKIDYRAEILAKRKENEELRQQALKKAEQEGNKKGGKKDNKGQPELKVNLYKEHPTAKEKVLQIHTEKAKSQISRLEFPDDFPPGKYYLQIRSPFNDFGELKPIKKEINIKTKIVKKK